ncbi:uncharacterized protein VICG_02241, partial [Vittaforma corneae ATCC 50505]
MKKVESRNKEIIEVIKEWSRIHCLKDFAALEHQMSQHMGFCAEFSPTILKILFICYNFDQDETLANKLLTDLIPDSTLDELVVIFNKITAFSDAFIEYCKQYSKVKKLKPIVSRI